MKIFHTDSLPPLDKHEQQCVYNAFDSLCTLDIFEKIYPVAAARPDVLATYEFEKSLIGPVLTMVRRGIKIDEEERFNVVNGISGAQDVLVRLGLNGRILALGGMAKQSIKGKNKWIVADENATLQQLVKIVWSKPLNYHSEKQLKEFFYEALSIPRITVSKKGVRKVSCDREALEKMSRNYIRAIPFCSAILRLRDLEKQRDVMTTELSSEGRWGASYNIGGTETGRWSSSDNPLGHSASIQNIDAQVRRAFVADPGYVMVNLDLQGAEARAVAYLAGDEEYIKAVESEDCHTLVAAMVFGIPPTIEASSKIFYRGFSYRELAKRLTHGTNYVGKAPTLARILGVEVGIVEEFQRKYFRRFPGIPAWHQSIATKLQTTGVLVSALQRRRQFWARLTEDSTLREAVANEPQSLIGDITARGILNIWRELEPRVQLLANGHDAVLLQIKREELDATVPSVLNLLRIPVKIVGNDGKERTLIIPSGVQTGFNWGKRTVDNPKGLGAYETRRAIQ